MSKKLSLLCFGSTFLSMLDLGELTLDISASPLLDLVIFRAFASGVVVEEFTKLVDITANQTLFSFFS